MKNKRILVTGADGMVGSYVNDVFSDHDLYLTDLVDMSKDCTALDVCNPVAVMDTVKKFKPVSDKKTKSAKKLKIVTHNGFVLPNDLV